jgi:uncharacterized protein with von Willebrand factor type A (vWA) domain
MRYRYSRWDNTQDVPALDADQLMHALADDLVSDGDVLNALQRITRWGVQQDGQDMARGLHHLLQQLRAQRQEVLERYNLESLLDHIRDQIEEIVRTERSGIERRLSEAREQGDAVRAMMESIAERKTAFLDSVPDEAAAALTALADYEFLEDAARAAFDQLMESLQRQVLETHSQSIRQSLEQLAGTAVQDLKEMLRDLNGLLQEHVEGGDPDFKRFAESHGRFFPGVESLDQLAEQLQEQAAYTEQLLRSMSPELRRSLERMMESVLRDDELRHQLAQVAEALQKLAPPGPTRTRYPFSGSESLTLEEALQLMRRLNDLDQLEAGMKAALESGDLAPIDADRVRRLMGDEAGRATEQLKQVIRVLEDAGYIVPAGTSFELTARGVRKIGQKALQDIFQHLKHDTFGRHPTRRPGPGGDQADEVKRYEFGDSFLLDINRTLMNAMCRDGMGSRPSGRSGSPSGRSGSVDLTLQDFEVFRTEHLTRSATVLMLDMSRSMPLRGCFVAAKKVAFALNSLITTQFPRDRLVIIGFSDFARELKPESLHHITWGDYVYGTNMQHGFMLARRLLGKQPSANKQIILITDGEPTAHFEGDQVHFSYPPTFRTFQETLREVKRCTMEGIVINTFMLERSHYLADFVKQMTRINHGRAFFATPDRLGDYILLDYVSNRVNA